MAEATELTPAAAPIMDPEARAESTPRPPRKRRRLVISCTECHRRKQKCDRMLPCSNCITRNKRSACRFETSTTKKNPLEMADAEAHAMAASTLAKLESNGTAQMAALGYAKATGDYNTTYGIYKRIEDQTPGLSPDFNAQMLPSPGEYNGMRERYKSLIRQLPARNHLDKLLVTYFAYCNARYSPVDEGMFRDQLRQWYDLPFQTLNRGPHEMHPDLQSLPALLFQMSACALQFMPPDYDPSLDNLKYAAAMTLDDLAADYSESGAAVMSLLGKRNTTLVTVQAGFLRCAYLKNCGGIIESWHCLAQTIRDAQEIDLHRAMPDHAPADSPQGIIEGLWQEQLRRRMWMLLSMWDIRMALCLGRPTTIAYRHAKPPLPMDIVFPKDWRAGPPTPRSPTDPPTTLTELLWNAELASPLWDIALLERDGPNDDDSACIERMHKLLQHVEKACPPFFRSHNPDTTFDSHPDCAWLPQSRAQFQTLSAFNVMALHRPYIFTQATSRMAALRASLDILKAQRVLFSMMDVVEYKWFSLVLSSFDALVLMAAIYIIYPNENRLELDDAMQHFEWSIERFQAMSEHNSLSRSALDVLRAIYIRFRRAVDTSSNARRLSSPSNLDSTSTPSNAEDLSSIASGSSYPPPPPPHAHTSAPYKAAMVSMASPSAMPPQDQALRGSWGIPPTPLYDPQISPSALAPLQPLHDLLYNDLATFNGEQRSGHTSYHGAAAGTPNAATNSPMSMDGLAMWQFGGGFRSDSFWGVMNNFNF